MQTEDCPLCCNPMSPADMLFPLHCPTLTCHFNYCADCIVSLRKSAKDGYEEASDGSKQVKIKLFCPQCRSKYECSKYPAEIVMDSVLYLRQAKTMETMLLQKDSTLSASNLHAKDKFLKTMTIETLQDSIVRIDFYQKEIGKGEDVPALDLKSLAQVLPEKAVATSSTSHDNSNNHEEDEEIVTSFPWRDPTLFYGLEELLSVDEQEFLTQLFCSGKPDLLVQAASILNGILYSDVHARSPARSTVDLHKIRKRYPLPERPPRCVNLPCYDPHNLAQYKSSGLRVDANLRLTKVRGPAGHVGLRPNDQVTHINGERVMNVEELQFAISQAYQANDENMVVAVNADEETAKRLQERAKQMKKDKVKM